MNNHRINSNMLHQDYIEGKLFFQIFIRHGMTTVFNNHGFMPEFLHIW